MKIWQISSFGIENLELIERSVPRPTHHQVLIKVHAVSLNYRDLVMVLGFYNPRLAMPRIPCSDGAGEVIAIGEDVTRVKPGQRVAGIFMQNWLDGAPHADKQHGALGGDIDGMLGEYVMLDENGVVEVPQHLSWEEAATLPCAAVTAWNAVVNEGRLKAGDTVAIQGTGGVSIFALQFAKMLGARVLGTSGSDAKLERARKVGLDAGVNYKSTPDWAQWMVDETGGAGVDLVVEVGGVGTLAQSFKSVRVGGTVAQIGVLAQSNEAFQVIPVLHKQIRLQGIYVGSRHDFEEMNKAISLHHLQPAVDEVFAFENAREAFQTMAKASHFGKLVIRVS